MKLILFINTILIHIMEAYKLTTQLYMHTEVVRIQTSLCWPSTTQRPVLSRKDTVALTLLPLLNLHCLAVFVFSDFFEFFTASLAKISCKGRTIDANCFV